MKTLFLTFVLFTAAFSAWSQDFEIPKNYKLEKAEDYAKYEQDVMDCFTWMMKTPVDQQTKKRDEANKFLIQWIMGSPTVHAELNDKIVTFIKKSPEMLIIFLGGWTNYVLETEITDNKIEGTKAGLEAVIEFYTKNKASLTKNKEIEKYIEMQEKGTLQAYIEKNA